MASTIADADTTIWGVHAGKTGDADTLFLKHGCVAIGWSGIGDLSKLKPDRETFKAKVAETYPDSKPGAIPTNGGQIFRFVHEMKPGDLVVYPSKRDRLIHVGVITGPYRYEPGEARTGEVSTGFVRYRARISRRERSTKSARQ